jgi:hypothetical protein
MESHLGMNTVCVFPSALTGFFAEPEENSDALALLRRMKRVDYGGAELSCVQSEFAFNMGIPLMVS